MWRIFDDFSKLLFVFFSTVISVDGPLSGVIVKLNFVCVYDFFILYIKYKISYYIVE